MIPRGMKRVARRKVDFLQSLGFECQVRKFRVGEFPGKKPFSTDFRKQRGQFRRGKEGFVGGLKFLGEQTHGLTVSRRIDHMRLDLYTQPRTVMRMRFFFTMCR